MTNGSSAPLRIAVLGAGGRGTLFGGIIRDFKDWARVAAVAEPRDAYRCFFARTHHLEKANIFKGWQDFCARPKMCDAVVLATMDRDHVGPAIACLEKGYHLFLEKPMATTLSDCQAIEAAQRASGKVVAVCHSLRYHRGFHTVKDLVDRGRIGRVITMNQIEQVSYWHQAHSFVRGNWGNEGRSTFMLLAKSCHDIDYMAYLIGAPCRRVASYGARSHFRAEHAPAGSTARCADGCAVERACPYSAIRQYVECGARARRQWPANVVSSVHTREAHLEAIRTGPYGRCVWRCDNDVVDHQVVAMEFAGDVTATFTMTAFTNGGGRKLRVHGAEGELAFDEKKIVLRRFGEKTAETIAIPRETGGHGGGDNRAIRSWLEAIHQGDPSRVLTSAQESLRTHRIVFAAEQSRREKRAVEIEEEAAESERVPLDASRGSEASSLSTRGG